jgi:rhomboid protease GluP
MNGRGSGSSFFEIPHAAVFLLITLNIFAYAWCLNQSGTIAISGEVLFRSGAMYSSAIERHEYWRLVAYGFLHADLFHLVTNMICLALWGGHLEKRIGPFNFMLVYVCALVVGGIVSDFTHSRAYLAVGASGAVSGVLGALLCLWILAKIDLAASFFVINIGLNVALALSFSRIDWGGHFGGFAAGLISCASLDLLGRANAHIFRCKFPEFVKINGLIVLGAVMLCFLGTKPPFLPWRQEELVPLLACFVLCFCILKLLDFVLSIKKGLAVIVIAFSVTNAALVLLVFEVFLPALNEKCAARQLLATDLIQDLLGAACANMNVTVGAIAMLALVTTILAYWSELHRGIEDVGFVGASLRAERQRRQGI